MFQKQSLCKYWNSSNCTKFWSIESWLGLLPGPMACHMGLASLCIAALVPQCLCSGTRCTNITKRFFAANDVWPRNSESSFVSCRVYLPLFCRKYSDSIQIPTGKKQLKLSSELLPDLWSCRAGKKDVWQRWPCNWTSRTDLGWCRFIVNARYIISIEGF